MNNPELEKLLETILAKLDPGDAPGRKWPDGKGEYWGLCPYHADSHAGNFSVSVRGFKCFSCGEQGGLDKLAAKLGIEIVKNGLTLDEYAAAKGLKVDFLRAEGLRDQIYFKTPSVRIAYFGADGRETAARYRLTLPKGTPDNRFRWQKGSKVQPYGLNHLDQAREARYIAIVEGESDAQTLWQAGFPALGIPGADTWREEWADYLDQVERIYIVIEPDQGGETVRNWLSKSKIRERAWLVNLNGNKDPSGLYLSDRDRFSERWQASMETAQPWAAIDEKQRLHDATEAYEIAKHLIHDPRLLDKVGAAIQSHGYAGDLVLPKTIYVALTSRLLERPQNLHLVAPSAAGKSHSVNAVLRFIPDDAYYTIKAGSPRALIYNDEGFEHRFVIVGEADSIPEDGPAASALRSIADDNFMEYEVTERDEETGQFTTRRIHKDGPTGIITTSLKSMREQMSTRVLELSVPDDVSQTRAVLLAHALNVSGEPTTKTDPGPFIALQRWLLLAGKHEAIIPFARIVAEQLPEQAVKDVRIRRDFRQLLTCTQAVALLYQAQRQIDEEGRVIATVDDYGVAYGLMEPVFQVIAAEGVTPAIRQTVAAVKEGEQVSQAELAARLKLSKNTVSWRVRKAIRGGWLVNKEEREKQPYKLALGTPLPEDIPALPLPEKIREVYECTNGFRSDTPPTDSFGDTESENNVVGVYPPESHSYIRTDGLQKVQKIVDEWNAGIKRHGAETT